jgi:hypothetical protein
MITSLSVATSVVQIIDFSLRLLGKGHEIYKNGSIASLDQAKSVAEDLKRATHLLTNPLDTVSSSGTELSAHEVVSPPVLRLSQSDTEQGRNSRLLHQTLPKLQTN